VKLNTGRWVRWLLAGIAAAVLVALAGAAWLVSTEAGLRRAVALVESVGPVTIRLTGARGRLMGPLDIDAIEVEHPRASIRVTGFAADYEPLEILAGRISAEGARIADARIALRPAPGPARPPSFMPGWLALVLDDADMAQLTIVSPAGKEVRFAAIRGSAKISRTRITFDGVQVRGEGWAVADAEGALYARAPLALEARARWSLTDDGRVTGTAQAAGDLDRLLVDARIAAPATGRVQAELRNLSNALRWRGVAQLEQLDLRQWIGNPPVGPLAGTFAVEGDLARYAARGVLRGPGLPAAGVRVGAATRYADRVLHVESLTLESAPGLAVRAEGSLAVGAEPAFSVAAAWTDFRWPLAGEALLASPRGRLTAEGWSEFSWRLDGDFRPAAGPPLTGEAAGRITESAIEVAESSWRVAGGRLALAGSLGRGDSPAWSLAGRTTDVDPATLHAALPGRLSFEFEGSGRGFEANGPWSAMVRKLRGSLRGQRVSGGGGIRRAPGELELQDLSIALGEAQLTADGVLGRREDFRARFTSDDLSALLPEFGGQVHATLAQRAGALEVSFTGHGLAWGAHRAVVLSADARVDRNGLQHSWLRLRSNGITLGGLAISDTRLALDGLSGDHTLRLRVGAGQDAVALRGRGGFADGRYSLQLEGIDASGPRLVPWQLEAPGRLAADPRNVSLDPVCLVYQSRRFCVQGSWQAGGAWEARATTKAFPLEALDPQRLGAPRYRGLLAVDATASGRAGEPWTADLRAEIRDASLAYLSAGGEERRVELGLTRLTLASDSQRHRLELGVSDAAALDLNVRLEAIRAPGASLGELPLSGSVKGRTRQLDLLALLVDSIDGASGEAQLDISVAGRVASPALEGVASFTDGTLDFYQTNLRLRELRGSVRLSGNSLTLDAAGRAGDGTLALDGRLGWRDRRLHGELAFTGDRLLLANVPEARVYASPDLRFRLDARRISVTGEVVIPEASIQPADTAGAVLVSADERIVRPEAGPGVEERFAVTSDVRLVLGDRVKVRAFGLSAAVVGAVRARSTPQGATTAAGELEVTEGRYRAYGRELEVERGRLLFTGGPVTDPGVDLRAIRDLPGYKVGVIARGPLRRPQLTLFSEPSLPQSQIVSMLIVGRSNLQSDPGAPDSGVSAAERGGAILAGQLGKYVGLDEVGLTEGADTGAELVLGKYLSPRLYVSYGISLVDEINTLKLRYTIGDHWVISAESGRESAADIEYRIEK
jgi:translocation and assembly module TamB